MAALQLAAMPAQPPHRSTIPTSLAAPLAHNGWLHPPRRSASEAQRGGAVGWKPLLHGVVEEE